MASTSKRPPSTRSFKPGVRPDAKPARTEPAAEAAAKDGKAHGATAVTAAASKPASAKPASKPAAAKTEASRPAGKKGPTPKRSEREQQNLRPIVPTDRKAAKKAAQAEMRAKQQEARQGMLKGDDRYLRESERGPQKRFMRDVIDARFSLGEILMPLMLLIIFTNFLGDNTVALVAMIGIWVYLAVCVIEALFVARSIKRRIAEVVGPDRVEGGIVMGTLGRCLQMRFMRMPKPQAPRFSKPEFTGR